MNTPKRHRSVFAVSAAALCFAALLMSLPMESHMSPLSEAVAKSKNQTPFDALTPLYKRLYQVTEKMLQGPLKDASPFILPKANPRLKRYQRRAYKQLAKISKPKLGFLVFEFETTLMSGKKGRRHIRWILGLTKHGWRVAEMRSYKTTSGRGIPTDQLNGASAHMAAAAKSLASWLRQKRCNQLPLLNPKDIPIFMPKRFTQRMFRGLKRTKKHLRELCNATSQLKFDHMWIYVDDIIGLVTNQKDELKGGIKLEWRLRSKGELHLGPPRFRRFR